MIIYRKIKVMVREGHNISLSFLFNFVIREQSKSVKWLVPAYNLTDPPKIDHQLVVDETGHSNWLPLKGPHKLLHSLIRSKCSQKSNMETNVCFSLLFLVSNYFILNAKVVL